MIFIRLLASGCLNVIGWVVQWCREIVRNRWREHNAGINQMIGVQGQIQVSRPSAEETAIINRLVKTFASARDGGGTYF